MAALPGGSSRAGAAGPRSGAFVPRVEEVLLKGQLLEGPEGPPFSQSIPGWPQGTFAEPCLPAAPCLPSPSLQEKLLGCGELGGGDSRFLYAFSFLLGEEGKGDHGLC